MKNKREGKSTFSKFIKISLIIHIILILLFFLFAFRQEAVEKFRLIKLQDSKKDTNEIPAALKPRKSEFGLVSFVDDIPQFTPSKAKKIDKQKQKGIKQQQKTIQKEEFTKKIIRKKQQKKKTARKKKALKIKKTKKAKTTITNNSEEEKPDLTTTSTIKDTKKAEEQKEIKEPPKIAQLKTFGADKKDKTPDVKPKKSILRMTQGFIENLRNEGNDWLKRDGDKNKRPSYEELKYLSYQQTIVWHLQAVWKQRFQDKVRDLPVGLSPVIYFVIEKNGNVEDINIAQTCGNSKLDKAFVRLIRETAPFPPIPKHFNKDKFKTGGHFTIVYNKFDV